MCLPVLRREGQGMTIELTKEARTEAIASIERYFLENMEERISNIAASALLCQRRSRSALFRRRMVALKTAPW